MFYSRYPCQSAWSKLRALPLFGCICTEKGGKCDEIYQRVNQNSCVGKKYYLHWHTVMRLSNSVRCMWGLFVNSEQNKCINKARQAVNP